MIKVLVFLLALTSSQVFAKTTLNLTKGEVSFLAIGRPSSLRVKGQGGAAKGQVIIDNDNVTGTVTFDMTSLTTGISLRDQHMKEKYLDTPKFPESSLTVLKLDLSKDILTKSSGEQKTTFTGELTLKGVTKTINGEMTISKSENTYSVTSEFKIHLPDFNVDIPKYMGITIAEDVTVNVESTLETVK